MFIENESMYCFLLRRKYIQATMHKVHVVICHVVICSLWLFGQRREVTGDCETSG